MARAMKKMHSSVLTRMAFGCSYKPWRQYRRSSWCKGFTLTLNFPLSYPFVLGARTDPCVDFRNMSVGFREIGDIAVSVTHHH